MNRIQFMIVAVLASLLCVSARAQGTGAPLTVVVPYPAGGVTDLAARTVAERLGPALNRTVIVENRPGGGSRIGTEAVIKAPADGNTLLFANASYAVMPIVDPTVKFDAEKSLAPVGLAAGYGLAMAVSNALPVTTLQEFIAYARRNPGKLSYGSSGPGSGTHFAGEYFKLLTGTFVVHIPYRSTSSALTDVAGGVLDMTFDATAKAYADAGKVKVLAVIGPRRDPRMPQVPTAAEAGLKDFSFNTWVGLLAPAGTPPAVIARLNAALNAALAEPAVQRRLQEMGMTIEGGDPERMHQQIRDDMVLNRRIMSESKLRLSD
ncbi:MAG: tripartite tricarboxylate transporter substrate-binding protein [Rubrivivax sp.]